MYAIYPYPLSGMDIANELGLPSEHVIDSVEAVLIASNSNTVLKSIVDAARQQLVCIGVGFCGSLSIH